MSTYKKKIEFKNCTLYHNGDYCTTVFNDGTETSNWVPSNDKSYIDVAKQCGFAEDQLMDYCFEHEYFHTFIPLKFFIREGYVTTRSARRIKMSEAAAMAEERLIYYFQRWFRDPDNNQMLDHNWNELANEARLMLFESNENEYNKPSNQLVQK